MAKKNANRKMAVHLNLNVRGLGASATLAINEQSNRLRGRGRTVYKLGLGQSPFPVPAPVVEAPSKLTLSKRTISPSRASKSYAERWRLIIAGDSRSTPVRRTC